MPACQILLTRKKIQKNEMFRSSLELGSRYASSAEFDAESNVDIFRPLPPLLQVFSIRIQMPNLASAKMVILACCNFTGLEATWM